MNKISRSLSLSRYRWTHTRTVLALVAPGVFSTSAAPSSGAAACLYAGKQLPSSQPGDRASVACPSQNRQNPQTQPMRDMRFLKSVATKTTYHNLLRGWRQRDPPKRRYNSTRLQGTTSDEAVKSTLNLHFSLPSQVSRSNQCVGVYFVQLVYKLPTSCNLQSSSIARPAS